MESLSFGSGLLCTGVTRGQEGKLNCTDIFTAFLAWETPTSIRNWFGVYTMYNLPIGTTNIAVSIARGKTGRGEKTTLATADINHKGSDLGSVLSVPLVYQFPAPGDYTIVFQEIGGNASIKIPLRVIMEPWPTFNKKEYEIIRNTPQIPKVIRSVINCAGCSRPYTFEEPFLPELEITEGTIRFPKDGIHECESCGHHLDLKDIQGQVRNSIKKAVANIKSGGR